MRPAAPVHLLPLSKVEKVLSDVVNAAPLGPGSDQPQQGEDRARARIAPTPSLAPSTLFCWRARQVPAAHLHQVDHVLN